MRRGKFDVCPAMRTMDVFVETFTPAAIVKSSTFAITVAVAYVFAVPSKWIAMSVPCGPGTTDVAAEHVIVFPFAIPHGERSGVVNFPPESGSENSWSGYHATRRNLSAVSLQRSYSSRTWSALRNWSNTFISSSAPRHGRDPFFALLPRIVVCAAKAFVVAAPSRENQSSPFT